MAPGFSNVSSSSAGSFTDTVDSFEVLEQTVMKQKRLAKKKKCDLRLRILLKRTFDLVCEIMDRENGFEDDYLLSDTTCTSSSTHAELLSTSSSDDALKQQPLELDIPLPPNPPPCPPPPPPSSDENEASKDEMSTEAAPMVTDDQQVPQEHQVLSSISENSYEKTKSAKKRKMEASSGLVKSSQSPPKRIKSVDINIHIKRGILVQAM